MINKRLATFIIVLVALFTLISTASAAAGDLQTLENDTSGIIDDASGSGCPGCTMPTAAFRAAITSGSAPFTAQFHDMSIGTVVDRYWDFTNDGNIESTTWNPTFTYTQPGTYSVRLIAVGCGGADIEVKTGYITVLPPATLALKTPNGVENWEQGSTQTIRWAYTGDPGPSVKIEALRGDTVLAVVTPNAPTVTAGSGSYNLTFPYSTPVGSNYRIRSTSTSNPAWTDTSDLPFTIVPAITVISPDGGEEWQQGSTQTIRWNYSGYPGPTVKIEAMRGDTVLAVVNPNAPIGTAGSGSYNLTFPGNTPVRNDYRIRVTSTSYPACTDTSDGMFAISAG